MTSKFVICPNCFEENKFKSMSTDRVELEKEVGENIKINCNDCGNIYRTHVNKVIAKPNKLITVLSVCLGVFVTVLFWNFGFVAFASLGIPLLIYQTQQNSASNFNKYMIK